VKGAEMKAGCLYVLDWNLEERINFKYNRKECKCNMCDAPGSTYIHTRQSQMKTLKVP